MNKQHDQGALAPIMFGPSFMSRVRAHNSSATKMDMRNASTFRNWGKTLNPNQIDCISFAIPVAPGDKKFDG